MDNYFSKLYAINVNDKVEKKGNLSYVSWPFAWAEVKKLFPDATYSVYENEKGWCYHTDGRTAWVKTGVTVNGIEHIEYLPVMDQRNRSIPLDSITSFDVNKTIQRSLTKACARHGLGLYIYAGEDLPEGEPKEEKPKETQKEEPKEQSIYPDICADCGKVIVPVLSEGKKWSADKIITSTKKKFGRPLCWDCAMKANEG